MEKVSLKQTRIYSKDLRLHIVRMVERGEFTVLQACHEYGIKSPQTVYNWLNQYSSTLKPGTKMVVEMESEQSKRIELLARIKELEAALGRKEVELYVYKQLVELAKKEYNLDLKKNFGDKL
jgi:transposase-like protein